MVAALEDDQGHSLFVEVMHEAVFLIDATGAASRQVKRSGFNRLLPVQMTFPRLGVPWLILMVMLYRLARVSGVQCFPQPGGIGRGTQQIGCLHDGVVVLQGH